MPTSRRSASDSTPTRLAAWFAAGTLLPAAADRLLRRPGRRRAIAWRAADSFALREFLGLVLPDAPPDHSTISRTRRLIDVETHEAVFTWILQRLADAGLVKGKTSALTRRRWKRMPRCAVSCGATPARATRLPDEPGAGLGHRDSDARGFGAGRSEAEEERLERRLDPPARSRREDHEDERRANPLGAQSRACRRSRDRGNRRRDRAGRRRRRHDDQYETLIEAAEQVEAVLARRRRHRRGRGRQGLSQQSVAGGSRSRGRAQLHLRTGSRTTKLEGNPAARDAVYRIAGAFAALAASACCDSAARAWNAPLPISTRPAGCAAWSSVGTRTLGSGC